MPNNDPIPARHDATMGELLIRYGEITTDEDGGAVFYVPLYDPESVTAKALSAATAKGGPLRGEQMREIMVAWAHDALKDRQQEPTDA